MNVGKSLKYVGNTNRILEMHDAGYGPCAIAGVFQDNGISITPQYVAQTVANYVPMTTKALPKLVVKDLINSKDVALCPT